MKTNRIYFAVAGDAATRTKIIEHLLLNAHLAVTPSGARALISPCLDESILFADSYYVAAASVANHLSTSTWRHLFSLANAGIFVAVGVRVPPSCADVLGDIVTIDIV